VEVEASDDGEEGGYNAQTNQANAV
jgi:hypothetical protein